ncbi:hypothetical protein B0H13DRAFT_2370263 [Mycena leptocephala]|nr:hypothetical protein B0H13DRAFT_2370263 [Mycena leptocephala]
MCGLYTQHDVLPSAAEKRDHYDKRFDKVDDYRLHMRSLRCKSSFWAYRKRHARIPAEHLATVFTMVQKAGLQGFCPDIEGPAYSTYNQLHRHLAVSAFQFLSSSFALMALNVNNHYAQDHNLCSDMYDNSSTELLRRTPRRRSVVPEASAILCVTVSQTKLAPVCVRLDSKQLVDSNYANLFSAWFISTRSILTMNTPRIEGAAVSAEEYRERNGKPGQTKPDTRHRNNPLLPPSEIGLVLPPDVPIDFFTPEFYNSLTVKERARYADTGVAFPLEQYVFNDAHAHWMKMGKADFMKAYGNEVLAKYNIPSPEEIAEQSDSDADDEEEEEIDLADTDDSEMEVDEELNG